MGLILMERRAARSSRSDRGGSQLRGREVGGRQVRGRQVRGRHLRDNRVRTSRTVRPLDVAVAVLAVSLDLILFTQMSDPPDQTAWVARSVPPGLIIGSGALTVIALSFRRRWPTAVCLSLAAYALVSTATMGSRPLISVLVALYTAAVWSSRRRAVLCLAAALSAHAVAVAYEASFTDTSTFAVLAVATVYALLDVATFAAGRWGASAAARTRARQIEASRAAAAAQAVDDERLRIARELHDIVAHAVTLMVVQTAGARRVITRDPELAAEAMEAVQSVGQQAVAELRWLLTVLRAEERDGDVRPAQPDSEAAENRAAGLVDLPMLIARVGVAGVAVRVESHGNQQQLDPSVDLAAYRLVQEALTNVHKHAGPGAQAVVRVGWQTGEVVIEVSDAGPAHSGGPVPTYESSGFGLVGLAERVHLIGGRLTTGPRTDGPGYRVRAVLPTAGPVPADELLGAGRR
jgi:signal transduction histidine kinase